MHPHSKLIDLLGGTTVVADMFNIKNHLFLRGVKKAYQTLE